MAPVVYSRADDVMDWIEQTCYVPEGIYIGKRIILHDFQRLVIKDIYDNPVGTRKAIISFARKNAKTSLAALLLLCHLCGPEGSRRRNSQLFSTAQSREQAAVVFQLAAKIVRMSPRLRNSVHIRDSSKELLCAELGTRYRALSAETSTAFGLSPAFVVHDELGQVRGPRSTLFEALETATAAQAEPLTIIISTQAATDNDLLSMLIDDAIAGHDPHTVVQLFNAPLEDDPFAVETIRKANPAFDYFMNQAEVLAMAENARRMPARESQYRNLILNQRVEVVNPFISPMIWAQNGAAPSDLKGQTVYAGLDLSEAADLTAYVKIARVNGVWQVHPIFWLPGEGLKEKAQLDRVPYDLWRDKGFLKTTPGNTISYEFVAQYLREDFARYNISKLGFDRWNFKHLKPWLLKAGFNEYNIKEHFVEFGQGMQSMSPALRELEQILLDRKIAHGGHPVLNMCVNNTVIVLDDAGNRKPSKRKSVGRIDGLVALAMAIGVAPLDAGKLDMRALIG
jgi:phage terminase large subunit-like protein